MGNMASETTFDHWKMELIQLFSKYWRWRNSGIHPINNWLYWSTRILRLQNMLCWETDVPFDPPALLITLTWKLSNDSVDMLPLVEIAFDCSIVKHEKSAPWLIRWWKLFLKKLGGKSLAFHSLICNRL